MRIERKFQCDYFVFPVRGRTKYIYKKGYQFISTTDFGIFSTEFIKKRGGKIFDETFVNGEEDHDLNISFFLDDGKYSFIDFKIGDYVGSTLGWGVPRGLRVLAGYVYLNFKWKKTIGAVLKSR